MLELQLYQAMIMARRATKAGSWGKFLRVNIVTWRQILMANFNEMVVVAEGETETCHRHFATSYHRDIITSSYRQFVPRPARGGM